MPAASLLGLYCTYIVVVFTCKPFFSLAPPAEKHTSANALQRPLASPRSSPNPLLPPASPRSFSADADATTTSTSTGGGVALIHRLQKPFAHLVALTMPVLPLPTDAEFRDHIPVSRASSLTIAVCSPTFALLACGFTPGVYGLHTFFTVATASSIFCTTITVSHPKIRWPANHI